MPHAKYVNHVKRFEPLEVENWGVYRYSYMQ